MTQSELVGYLRQHKEGVVSTIGPGGAPQAAVVGIAISDRLEIVFDTMDSTRKAANIRRDPRVSVTVWQGERTAQIDGIADIPEGDEHERVLAVYLEVYPDGRERLEWPGILHVRVRPTWVRYSDFDAAPPIIAEMTLAG